MDIVESVFLGVLQGLTEFLPVSSSGHLVIAQHLIPNFSQPGVLFDVVLHMGTLFSVLMYFRKELIKIKINYLLLLAVASIPAALVGVLFSSTFESLFTRSIVVGFALLLTALFNYLTDKVKAERESITVLNAIYIGIAQAFAIIPGISRSGSTIFAGVKQGIDKRQAAYFSFVLSIPAIAGANLLQVVKYGGLEDIFSVNYLLGFLAAFLAGLFAIKLVLNYLMKSKFIYFSVYCFVLGMVVLVFLH